MRVGRLLNLDFPLLLCTLAALMVGIAMVYSATNGDKEYAIRQGMYGAMGLAAMFIVMRTDYLFLESFTVPFYLGTVGLLGVVLILGHIENGSQRWISLGFFQLQPSELAKLTLVIVLAKLLSNHKNELGKFKWFILAGILTGIPAVLVFVQPDLGTALMLGAIFLGMTIAAGVRPRIFILTLIMAVPAVFALWTWFMHDYQRDRLTIFLHPESDITGAGWNIIQARIAVGSGGLLGQGYMAGNQSGLGFLKVRYSDFIFSVVAEEFGLIGSIALCALLFLLVWRCLVVASHAGDDFGSLLCVGTATWIGMQVFVNVGMNIGLMPVTGIPLPFISYGGSAFISMLLGLGLVHSVALRSSPVIFGSNPWNAPWTKFARTSVRTR